MAIKRTTTTEYGIVPKLVEIGWKNVLRIFKEYRDDGEDVIVSVEEV